MSRPPPAPAPGQGAGHAAQGRGQRLRRLVFPLLIGLAGVAMLAGLGVWQLQRLAWKEGLLAAIEARLAEPPAALPRAPDPLADQYRAVRLAGRFTGEDLDVLASRRREGPGFRVIAAFETDDGRRIMIDRGFIAEAQRAAPRPAGAAGVTGNLLWPEATDRFTPAPDPSRGIWFARDVAAMAAALATLPVLVVQRSGTGAAAAFALPQPVGTEGIPNDHRGYAITWFLLAAVWAGMTALLLWRITRRPR